MQANKQDAEIMHHVLDELRWDPQVDETDIGIEVHSGTVTLTGTVANWAKRCAARDAAHRVAGVLDVADDIRVKRPLEGAITDAEIADAARAALRRNAFVPASRIRMTISDGIVLLEGDVEVASQRDEVVRTVGSLDCVRGIDNQIAIVPFEISPDLLRTTIADALERRATRDAKRIKLDVEGGTVTISGTVYGWPERQAVLGAVRGTRGVDVIVDHLRYA